MFLKIFLWFWLAITVVVGVLAITSFVTQSEPVLVIWRAVADETLRVFEVAAKNSLESGGAGELERNLNEIRQNSQLDAIVFNARNDQITIANDDNLLTASRNLAAQTQSSSNTEFLIEPPFALAARRFQLGDGTKFVVVARLPRPRIAAMNVDWQTRFIRFSAAILAAGLVCLILANYLTRPLRQLREVVKQFADGNLAIRITPGVKKRRDEIGDLARDFDEMAEKIEKLISAQKNLTADISHELRSPLARLNVALEIAKQKSAPETASMLDRIERESNRLNEMIGEILLLSKLESGVEKLEKKFFSLPNLIAEIAADARFEIEDKQIEFVSTEQITICADRILLHRAIENVIRNAVKHAAQTVIISIAKAEKNVEITISDDGQGVSDEAVEKLFRPFYRADTARTHHNGIGLGLAIAERAIAAHNGKIVAENSKNSGLRVRITLTI